MIKLRTTEKKNKIFNEEKPCFQWKTSFKLSEGNVLNEKLFILLMYEFISEKSVSDSLTNDKDEDS